MSLTVICGICCLGFWETVIGIFDFFQMINRGNNWQINQ